jgi:hypothetical protein
MRRSTSNQQRSPALCADGEVPFLIHRKRGSSSRIIRNGLILMYALSLTLHARRSSRSSLPYSSVVARLIGHCFMNQTTNFLIHPARDNPKEKTSLSPLQVRRSSSEGGWKRTCPVEHIISIPRGKRVRGQPPPRYYFVASALSSCDIFARRSTSFTSSFNPWATRVPYSGSAL